MEIPSSVVQKELHKQGTSEGKSVQASVATHYSLEPLEGSSTQATPGGKAERQTPDQTRTFLPVTMPKVGLPSSGRSASFFSFQFSFSLSLSLSLSPPSLPPSLNVKIIHSDEVAPQPENESSNEKVRQANNNKERNREKGERGLVRGKDLRTRKGQMFRKYMQSKTGCTLNTSTEKQTNHCALPPATLMEPCIQKKKKVWLQAPAFQRSVLTFSLNISQLSEENKIILISPLQTSLLREKKGCFKNWKGVLR